MQFQQCFCTFLARSLSLSLLSLSLFIVLLVLSVSQAIIIEHCISSIQVNECPCGEQARASKQTRKEYELHMRNVYNSIYTSTYKWQWVQCSLFTYYYCYYYYCFCEFFFFFFLIKCFCSFFTLALCMDQDICMCIYVKIVQMCLTTSLQPSRWMNFKSFFLICSILVDY